MGPIHGLNRAVAVGVSIVFSAQCLFAYQPEKSFWDGRRGAARATRSVDLAYRLLPGEPGSPLVTPFPSFQSVRSSLAPSMGRSLPSRFLMDHGGLFAALSPAYGTVRNVWPGETPGKGRVVVHVQDVHQNAEAQWNIRGVVSDLVKTGQVGVVALEGATEAIDLKPFLDFPHRKAVGMAADYFLKENRISGPIHALLTAPRPLPRIQGIDDPVHYEANVQAVRASLAVSSATLATLHSIQSDIDKKKETVFSSALLALDHTVTDYRNENISLGDFVERLSSAVSLPSVSLQAFLLALQTERSLDFKQVEIERSRLIEKLMHTLSPAEIDRLMGESLAYRSGQRRFAEFYAGLKILCGNHGIRLEESPAMDAYVKYVLSVDGIDPGTLMKDMATLEKMALARLAQTSEERDLIVRSRQAWLAGRLVDFALTPSEWEEWSAAPTSLSVNLAPFESFYREASARDGVMAENLWAALKEDDVAVLVTGGFHAEGLDRQLVRRGVTVISYVPKISKVDTAQGAAYLSVFTQEKTPLEKLFRGEKLFLSANPIAPADLKIQLPMVVMLVALLTAGNLDPQLLYQALGGLGTVHDVVSGSGYAQAAVALGAGALIFRCALKGNVIDKVDSFITKRGLATEFKIKVWDPLREQAKYFLPWVIVVPFILSLSAISWFDGGIVMFSFFYYFFGSAGLFGMVPLFIEQEHKNYSVEMRSALIGTALWVGALTLGMFFLSFTLLSPMGFNLIEFTDPFYALIPNGEVKSFVFATFLGFFSGLWKHISHNAKTFENYEAWRRNELIGPDTLMPLSRSAAGRKSLPVPALSLVKINLPKGVPRERMLDSLFNWTVLNLDGPRATIETIDVLVDRLKNINPKFCSANTELLADRDRLKGDPSLVKKIIHSAVFLPLNAHPVGFRNRDSRWVGLDTSWEGYFYLGEEIWLVHPAKTAQHTDLIAQYGVGMLPAVNYDESGEALVLSALINKNRPLNPQENWNLSRWGRTMGDAARERNRGILLRLMIDAAFASRISIQGDYNPAPLNSEIAKSILREGTQFPWKEYQPESSVYVAARLAGLAQGLAYLKSENEPLLGIILFRAELIKFLGGESDNKGRLDAIRALAKTLVLQLDPIRQFQQANNDMKALDAAIALVDSIRDKNFYSFKERYALVYGKNPGAHALELTRIGIQQKNLSLLPESGRKNFLSLDRVGKQLEMAPPTVSVPGAGIENSNQEDVKSGEERRGDSSSVLGFEEALLGQADGGSVEKLNDAIATLRWFYSSGNLSPEEDERLKNVLLQLQEKLWGKIKESSAIVENLLGCAKSLALGTDEVLFLQKYRDLQRKGQLPSYAAITAGENEKTETGLLEAHERLVQKLVTWNLLPVGPDETETEDIADDFSDEGDLAPFLNEGVRVVIYRDYFRKGVEHNKNAQKAVLNVVKTLVQRAREAVEGKPIPISKSRSGLYKHGVHQFLTNEYNVFVKLVGKIIVVLWIGPKDKSHGRRSFTADRVLSQEIGSQVDNLPWQAEKYVDLNPDFSENRSEDVQSIFRDGENAHGNGFLSSLVKGPNSLVYLVTGRPGMGLVGAAVEGISLVTAGLFLGAAPMFLGVLPIFSLLHVGIRVLQKPDLKWSDGLKLFFWHFVLAAPYGLVGVAGFHEIVGGEGGASVVAMVWHLVSDGVIMARDQRAAGRDAKWVGEILVDPGSVESMLLPESGPLHVEEILGPSRVWLEGVQRRLGEPEYARAFEKAFLREVNRGRSGTVFPASVPLQLGRLVSFITGRPVNEDVPSTVITIVRSGDVPEALRTAQLTSALAQAGRRPPRLVLAGADVATVAALQAGGDPGVVDVVAEPVAPGDQLDTAVLVKGLHGFNLSAEGRFMFFLSPGIQIDPVAVSRLTGEGIEQALQKALMDLLNFVRLSPMDFRNILEVLNHTSTSA